MARAQSIIRSDPGHAAEVVRKLFPATEAELVYQILERDAEFYRADISIQAIIEMNGFAIDSGLLSRPVLYEQVVAAEFESIWSE
jgi:hypothetical protein